jgi:antitoxin component of RelBE/YafQ-DinJ toxin-antitoxin module
MNSATIFFKTDPKVKEEASETAAKLGFSLSSLLNAYLREFVRTKTVNFSAKELEEVPNDRAIARMKEAEEDFRAGRVISFASGEEAHESPHF